MQAAGPQCQALRAMPGLLRTQGLCFSSGACGCVAPHALAQNYMAAFFRHPDNFFRTEQDYGPPKKTQAMSRGTEMRTKSGHLSRPRKPSRKYSATTVQPPFLLTDFRARNRVQKWTPEYFPPRITPRGFALRGPGPWAIKVEAPPRNAAGCASAASSRPAEIPTGRHGRLAEKDHEVVPRHHVAWPWHTTR